MVLMSFNSGTLSSAMVSAVRRLAQRIGRAAFLAPDTEISPCRRRPPVMRSLSIRVCLVLFRGQGAHRERVDFLFHPITDGRVHQLMAGDQAFAFKGLAHDQRF